MKYTHLMLLGLIGLFSFASCVRERDTDTSYAVDQTTGEMIFSNAIDIADDAATKQTGEFLSNYKNYCTYVTHDKVSMPRKITIDFGAINCLCTDGRNRKGKILISYSGTNYADSLGTVSISFENYFIDEHQVFGTIAMTNNGRNIASQPYYKVFTKGKYLKPLVLDTLVWNADRDRTQIEGSTTPVWSDDVFEYIGSGNGLNQYKVYFASNITKPLVYDRVLCKHINEGKVELQPQGHALRTINYGEGNCDDDATVVFNSKMYNIKLK